jgi:CMP/dCMP kinase
MIITIDGPVATGKSAVAKKLAQAIGFIFFDTGAMYRTITYAILKHNIDIHQLDQFQAFLDRYDMDIRVFHGEKHYFFENEDISERIRGKEVTAAVSEIAAIKMVRDKLTAIQRELALGVNAVFEGRDMGTVVFPDADLKIFLTADNDIRAERRYEELMEKYPKEHSSLTLEQCLEDIVQRDTYDSTRECAPLHPAEDSFIIDTSDLTIAEVVDKILEYKDTLQTDID